MGSLLALPVADAVTMLACFALGGLVNFSFQNVTEERTLILAAAGRGAAWCCSTISATTAAGASCGRSSATSPAIAAVALLFDLALLYLLKVNFSRLWVLTSWALVVPAVPLVRRLVKQVALELGHWLQPTVIVGTGPNAREIAAAYDARNNHLGYQVQAFLDPAPEAVRAARCGWAGATSRCCPWTRGASELPGWLGQPHVVVALELDEMLGREGLIESLSFYHGDIDVISPLKGLPINNTRVSHFFSRDILSLAHPQQPGAALAAAGQARLRPAGGLRTAAVHRAAAGAGRGADQAGRRRRGDLRPHPGRPARPAVPVLQVPHHGRELGRGAGRAAGQRPGGAGRVGAGPEAAPRPPDHRRSAASCARPASTSCRSCSTWCAAR